MSGTSLEISSTSGAIWAHAWTIQQLLYCQCFESIASWATNTHVVIIHSASLYTCNTSPTWPFPLCWELVMSWCNRNFPAVVWMPHFVLNGITTSKEMKKWCMQGRFICQIISWQEFPCLYYVSNLMLKTLWRKRFRRICLSGSKECILHLIRCSHWLPRGN